jgi:malate synthase
MSKALRRGPEKWRDAAGGIIPTAGGRRDMSAGIEVLAKPPSGSEEILSREALDFLESLQRAFEPTRRALLAARAQRQAELDRGALPGFLARTESVRQGAWKVAAIPKDLEAARGRYLD